MAGINLFGIYLSNLFGKSRKSSRRKNHSTKKHVKKGRNQGRKRGTRKYKMRGG